MKEYGLLLDDGQLIVGPGWACVADVIASAHGHGMNQVPGKLVAREDLESEWEVIAG